MIDEGTELKIDEVIYMKGYVKIRLHTNMNAREKFYVHLHHGDAIKWAGMLLAVAGEIIE